MDTEQKTLLCFAAFTVAWLYFGFFVEKYIDDERGIWTLFLALTLPCLNFLYHHDIARLIPYGRVVGISFAVGVVLRLVVLTLRYLIAKTRRSETHGSHRTYLA